MKTLLALTFAVLVGCSSFTPPKSLDQSLAEAQAQVTGLETSAAQALSFGLISSNDAKFVLNLGDQASAAISLARKAEGTGDTSSAQAQLAIATQLLLQLSSYLQTHGVK